MARTCGMWYVVFLITGTLSVSVTGECTTTAVKACSSPLSNQDPDYNFSVERALKQPINGTFFQDVCSKWSSANDCIQSSTTCGPSDLAVQMLWSGVNESVSYICKEGRQDLIQFQRCVTPEGTAKEYSDELSSCIAPIQHIPEQSPDQRTLCYYENGLMSCYVKTANRSCNSASFAMTYFIKLYHVSMDTIGCTLDLNSSPSILNAPSVCNGTALKVCLSPLLNLLDAFKSTFDTEFMFLGVPIDWMTQLPEICSEVKRANECIPSTTHCTSSDNYVRTQWSGLNDSLSYLCYDGKEGLIQFQQCLTSNSKYLNIVSSCLNAAQSEKSVNYACNFYNSMLSCYANAAGIVCGSANFAATYFTKSVFTLAAISNCELSAIRGQPRM